MGIKGHNIFQISVFSGECGDPEKIAQQIAEYEKFAARNSYDHNKGAYQDRPIPTDPWLSDEIKEVWDYIGTKVEEVAEAPVYPTCRPWFILNDQNEQIYPHTHDSCSIATVYWARVAEKCGDLFFYPMGLGSGWSNEYRFTPEPGVFLIFDSKLLHGVPHNISKELRISMSRNYEFVGK
jgi:hypothetical protein